MSLQHNANAQMRVWKRAPAIVGLAGVLSIAGCTVGPKYHRPAAEVPPAYKEVGDWKPAQPNDQNLGGNWWETFQDPQLNTLEAQVNVSNQNLKAAEAQYTQARALLRYHRADLFPTVGANPSATRSKTSANHQPHSPTFNGVTVNDFQIPFELSYQIDVWGRVRRTVESYRDQAQASAADLAAVNLSMHSQLALFYFQARVLDAEEQLLNSTVKQYEQALELINSRFAGGIASDVEVQQAETQLETTRAQAIDVGVARAQYEHAVAVLIGKPPASSIWFLFLSLCLLPRFPWVCLRNCSNGDQTLQLPSASWPPPTRRLGSPSPPTIRSSIWQPWEALTVALSQHYSPARAFCGRPGHRLCLLSST